MLSRAARAMPPSLATSRLLFASRAAIVLLYQKPSSACCNDSPRLAEPNLNLPHVPARMRWDTDSKRPSTGKLVPLCEGRAIRLDHGHASVWLDPLDLRAVPLLSLRSSDRRCQQHAGATDPGRLRDDRPCVRLQSVLILNVRKKQNYKQHADARVHASVWAPGLLLVKPHYLTGVQPYRLGATQVPLVVAGPPTP